MGDPFYFFAIFGYVYTEEKNKSGSISVQILSKSNGKNKLVKSIGSSFDENEIAILVENAKHEINTNLNI